MFSDLILRNSNRSRRENGLFFGSLLISIVAFYMILSLSSQDVMVFLAQMESDAVNRLLTMIPVFCGITLGILFFLIYFACQYQLERRKKEFGVYLMMGMHKSRLFTMLLAEHLLTGILALLLGLPIAVLLAELISLVTARLVGMQIIGHQFTFSLPAIGFTIAGFLAINLGAFWILSSKISRQEIDTLLAHSSGYEKKQKPAWLYGICTASGVMMLAAAYAMSLQRRVWYETGMLLLLSLLGLSGTMLLFYGIRAVIALLVKAEKVKRKFSVFTLRQIQENVRQQSASMAISSLLITAALCCFGAGIGIAASNRPGGDHVPDYTFTYDCAENPRDVFPRLQTVLRENDLDSQFSQLFAMRIGYVRTTDNSHSVLQMDSVLESLRSLGQSADRDILLHNLRSEDYPHLICLSDYNNLLQAAGKPVLTLAEMEAAVYQDCDFTNISRTAMLNKSLSTRPQIILDGNPVTLTGEIQSADLVTDRSITLSFALILPDEQFLHYTGGNYEVYVNGIIKRETGSGNSLMTTISDLNTRLDGIGLQDMGIKYESYLQNMGRQLFYMVAGSYITIYLAIIFLVVANTVMGVQFLMNQQKTGRRYQTLVCLGATYQSLCASARRQINWFMGLPVFVASVSSFFGVKVLFTAWLSSRVQGTREEMLWVSAAMIVVLCMVEYIYMTAIKRSSDRYLLTWMQPQREE